MTSPVGWLLWCLDGWIVGGVLIVDSLMCDSTGQFDPAQA